MNKEDKENENHEEKHELVRIISPIELMSKDDALNSTDMLAYLLLKDFITSGYPKLDPKKQVDAAYSYAELMSVRRKK